MENCQIYRHSVVRNFLPNHPTTKVRPVLNSAETQLSFGLGHSYVSIFLQIQQYTLITVIFFKFNPSSVKPFRSLNECQGVSKTKSKISSYTDYLHVYIHVDRYSSHTIKLLLYIHTYKELQHPYFMFYTCTHTYIS